MLTMELMEEVKENEAIERCLKVLLREKINFPTAERILDRTRKIMERLEGGIAK